MSDPVVPYLALLRTQLEESLVPRDENARKIPVYMHRMLTVLIAKEKTLPKLQQKALSELGDLLDELLAEIGSVDGGMVLIPQLIHHIRVRSDYETATPYLQSAVRLLTQKTSSGAARLQTSIARIMFELQEAFSTAVIEQDLKSVAEEKLSDPLDASKRAALRDYLRKHFPAETAIDIGPVKSIIGGGSKQTLIVDLINAKALPAAVVVRVDRSEGVVDSTVADEYQLIKTVYEAGVPSPQPFAIETSKEVLGAPFVILSRIPGSNIGDWFEVTEPSRTFALGLARTLAKLHGIPVERVSHLRGATVSTKEQVARDIRLYEETWRASGEPSVAMEQGLGWLKRNLDLADGKRSIIHCDVGCHNILAQDGELTALLDWETAVIGNPAHDLMYTYNAVVQMMPWEEYLAEYEKAGGTIPSKSEMDFYHLLSAFSSIHYMYMARSYFFSGLSTSAIHAYATQRIYLYCTRFLASAVKVALESEVDSELAKAF